MLNCLSDVENRFLAEVEKRGGAVYHDYSKPLHYNYALANLGGKAFLKKNHPVVLDLFEKTKADHAAAKKLGANATADASDKDGFSDSMKVRGIAFDNEYLISDISANHVETRPSMAISAKIVDTTNERIVATVQTYDSDIDSLYAELKKLASELVSSNDKSFKTVADFYWLEEKEGNSVASSGYTQVYNDFKVVGRNSIVSDFTVNAPIAVKTPGRANVVVVYNRTAQVGEDYDYSYDNSPHGNKVDIYLPASATVTLTSDWIVEGLNQDMGYKLEIEDMYKGVVKYYGSGGFDSIKTEINANVIKFTFQDNRYPADPKYKDFWNNALDISRFSAKTTVNIYCQVELNIRNKAGLSMHIPVVFQSKDKPSGDKSIATSKPVFIQWGCVGKDTLIAMADKTYKAVSKIKIGDMVLNEKGEKVKVANIYTGQEKTVTLIETKKQKKVLVTSGHPVAAKRGVIPASALNAADKIRTVDGFEAIKELRVVDYNDTVYSLRFADAQMLPCNGIILGDFDTQQTTKMPEAKNKPVKRHSKECRAAQAAFMELFEQISSNARVS